MFFLVTTKGIAIYTTAAVVCMDNRIYDNGKAGILVFTERNEKKHVSLISGNDLYNNNVGILLAKAIVYLILQF